jgi:hypothetical protein
MTKYELKRKIKATRKRRGSRYPAALQRSIEEYAELRQAAGLTFREVADELGINWHTMMGWRKRRPSQKKLRPVRVVADRRERRARPSAKSVTVRFPSGVTVDGLDVAQVAELMRSLS